jgi:hypothetical protein
MVASYYNGKRNSTIKGILSNTTPVIIIKNLNTLNNSIPAIGGSKANSKSKQAKDFSHHSGGILKLRSKSICKLAHRALYLGHG